MEYTSRIKLGSAVSLVVCPIDDYTAKKVQGGSINIFIQDVPIKPMVKHEGYYVFTGLPEGAYKIVLESDQYVSKHIEVSTSKLEDKDRTVYVKLKPRTSYNFPGGATLIRSTLLDASSKPAINAEVKAVVLSDNCARARVSKEGAKKGDKEVLVVDVSGSIVTEDCFIIKDKDQAISELCKATKFDQGTKTLVLTEPLENSYGRGALLLPVVFSSANENGETVIYFRNLHNKFFNVQLTFSYDGKFSTKELKVEEGKTAYTGSMIV